MVIEYLLKIKIGHQITADDDEVVVTDIFLSQFDGPCRAVVIIWNDIGDLDTKIAAVFEIVPDNIRFADLSGSSSYVPSSAC